MESGHDVPTNLAFRVADTLDNGMSDLAEDMWGLVRCIKYLNSRHYEWDISYGGDMLRVRYPLQASNLFDNINADE